jgi:hypothetical protein
MAIEMLAKVRRFVISKAGLSLTSLRATGTESLAIAVVEPEFTELTRAGRRFFLGQNAATTGIVSTATQVTTAPQWVIWNADPSRSYVFDHIGAIMTSTGALTAPGGIIVDACIFQAPAQTGAPSVAGTVVQSCSAGGFNSKAIIKTGVTITTPAAPTWFNVARSETINPVAFTIACINYDLRGRIIVPPGQGLGIVVYATPTGTPLFTPVAMWSELDLDLE